MRRKWRVDAKVLLWPGVKKSPLPSILGWTNTRRHGAVEYESETMAAKYIVLDYLHMISLTVIRKRDGRIESRRFVSVEQACSEAEAIENADRLSAVAAIPYRTTLLEPFPGT